VRSVVVEVAVVTLWLLTSYLLTIQCATIATLHTQGY
jgi:hypothetical protein